MLSAYFLFLSPIVVFGLSYRWSSMAHCRGVAGEGLSARAEVPSAQGPRIRKGVRRREALTSCNSQTARHKTVQVAIVGLIWTLTASNRVA